MGPSDNRFTWRSQISQSRLDRFLCSTELLALFPLVEVISLPCQAKDFRHHLFTLRRQIRTSRTQNWNYALARVQTLDAMEDLRPLTTEETKERKTCREEVVEADLRIEMDWHQQSHQIWLAAGDSFFPSGHEQAPPPQRHSSHTIGKNLCTIGKHRLTLEMKAASPRVEVCKISQSSKGPYLFRSPTNTKSSEGCINRHTHLVNRAMLVCKRFRMPSPPWDASQHTVFHTTSAAPRVFSSWGPLQKKLCMIFSRHLLTPVGILKIDT